jgi:hypothetical protein
VHTRLLTLSLVVGLAVSACDGSTPTQPTSSSIVLQKATVSVAGTVVNGTTVSRDHETGASTRFEAHLVDLAGRPALGHTARIDYMRPNGHGSMMNGGRMTLYDDGTHGDRMANDGIYCFEDFGGEYGCHGANAPMGRHDYDFFGMDHSNGETNHMLVTVTVG